MSVISKETFCKALALIKEQEKIDEEITEALAKAGNGHFVFGASNGYLKALELVLKETVGDQYDTIGWWLYETTDDFTIWNADRTKSWDLTLPENLYDYIISECL